MSANGAGQEFTGQLISAFRAKHTQSLQIRRLAMKRIGKRSIRVDHDRTFRSALAVLSVSRSTNSVQSLADG